MAKMSRNQLKSLIKECLVEVLVEGLNPGSKESFLKESSTPKRKSARSIKPPSSRSAVDSDKLNQRIDESVNACTSDPILGNILADTARTTLQEQLGEESNHAQQVAINGDQAAKMAAGNDPNDMFGEAANNWAALAFNEV
jgi:hypothetical protein